MSPPLCAINLNLLVALDALLRLRSVTAAAREVGVSQPAMSKSLKQLRELFDDPLLVRGRDGYVLTPRAARLGGHLHWVLDELTRVIGDDESFDPTTSTRVFRVAMPDYLHGLIGPAIAQAFIEEAPRASVMLQTMDRATYADQLEEGVIDVAIHACLSPPTGLQSHPLVVDRFACALRSGHPALDQPLTLEAYTALPHCLIAVSDDISPGSVDLALAEHGLHRHVVCRTRSFLSAPLMVAESDAILTGPERLLRWFSTMVSIELRPAPLPVHGFAYAAVWHERFEHDPAHEWLRELLLRAAAPHPPAPEDREWTALWGEQGSMRRRELVRRSGTRVI